MSNNDGAEDMKAKSIADHALMIMAARFMMVFGVPAVIALCGWVLLVSIDIQVRMGKIETKLSDGSYISDYHASDAIKDFMLRDYRIGVNTDGLRIIDGRVSYIERNALFKKQ